MVLYFCCCSFMSKVRTGRGWSHESSKIGAKNRPQYLPTVRSQGTKTKTNSSWILNIRHFDFWEKEKSEREKTVGQWCLWIDKLKKFMNFMNRWFAFQLFAQVQGQSFNFRTNKSRHSKRVVKTAGNLFRWHHRWTGPIKIQIYLLFRQKKINTFRKRSPHEPMIISNGVFNIMTAYLVVAHTNFSLNFWKESWWWNYGRAQKSTLKLFY